MKHFTQYNWFPGPTFILGTSRALTIQRRRSHW